MLLSSGILVVQELLQALTGGGFMDTHLPSGGAGPHTAVLYPRGALLLFCLAIPVCLFFLWTLQSTSESS